MQIYILLKDYKIETTKGTIILGKTGDQLLRSDFYESGFKYIIDSKIRDVDIDLFNEDGDTMDHYQYSVFNLDRPIRIKESSKNSNINTFVVKDEDVYLLSLDEKKLRSEIALEYVGDDSSDSSKSKIQSEDYNLNEENIYIMLESFGVECNKYKFANKGDLVISTGNYSNLFQFEVISASKSVKEDRLLNNGVFVVDKDKVLHLPNTFSDSKDMYLQRALKRLALHNNELSELERFERILAKVDIPENRKSEIYNSDNYEANKDFWNNLLSDSGVSIDDEDVFFDSFHN